jgi:hypothetical protein
MATIVADNIFNINGQELTGTPAQITGLWKDRVSGTAFVESSPMEGFVIALSLAGPVVLGVSTIDESGNWEIVGIPQAYENTEILVLGVPKASGVNYAIASRVNTV